MSLLLWWFWTPEESNEIHIPKIKGMNLEAPRKPVSDACFVELKDLGNEWVALIPYAFIGGEAGLVQFNHERQWWGEKDEGIRSVASMARTHSQKVMIKPHVWIWNQGWPGEYAPATEDEWQTWESSYRDYILHFARLAQESEAELFCIGTEFRKTATLRPEYWVQLIDEVREIYDGQLTYAANWDNYQNISFWDKLDFIGIDAYFPLFNDQSVDQLKSDWDPLKIEMKSISERYDIPVLFTEFGYRSVEGAANGHWETEQAPLSDPNAQALAYKALFTAVWNEPWFAGGFAWKWHMETPSDNKLKTGFTPQKKPAEEAIRQAWSEQK